MQLKKEVYRDFKCKPIYGWEEGISVWWQFLSFFPTVTNEKSIISFFNCKVGGERTFLSVSKYSWE